MTTQPQRVAILQKHLDCYDLNQEIDLMDYLNELNDAIEEMKLNFFIGVRNEDGETSLYAYFNKSKKSAPNKLHIIEIIFNHDVYINDYTIVGINNKLFELEAEAKQTNQLFFSTISFDPTPIDANGLFKLKLNN